MRWSTTLVVALLLAAAAATPAAAEDATARLGGVEVMPGGRVVDGTIVYRGGNVVVHPRSAAASFDSCPAGYVCLFDQTSWNGMMVALNDCCAWVNLGGYGFNNAASSWRNRMGVDAQIAMNADGGGDRLCLNNNSYDASMSSTWSNSASSIRVRDGSGYC